jgi:polar amino acid transport system substrate-binding protein
MALICNIGWFAVLITVATPSAAECALTIRLGQYPPYLMRNQNGEPDGVSARIVEEALRRIGCKAIFIDRPYLRALAELETGELAVVTDLPQTAELERIGYFSAPFEHVPSPLFIRTEDKVKWKISSLEDMKRQNFRLGIETGTAVNETLNALKTDPAFGRLVQQVTPRENLWKMLIAGRVDGVVADEYTAQWEIKKLGFKDKIIPEGFIDSSDTVYFVFSRKVIEPSLVEKFNLALTAMRRDGSYAKTFKKFGLAPGQQ